jgi:hypothetical protein
MHADPLRVGAGHRPLLPPGRLLFFFASTQLSTTPNSANRARCRVGLHAAARRDQSCAPKGKRVSGSMRTTHLLLANLASRRDLGAPRP